MGTSKYIVILVVDPAAAEKDPAWATEFAREVVENTGRGTTLVLVALSQRYRDYAVPFALAHGLRVVEFHEDGRRWANGSATPREWGKHALGLSLHHFIDDAHKNGFNTWTWTAGSEYKEDCALWFQDCEAHLVQANRPGMNVEYPKLPSTCQDDP